MLTELDIEFAEICGIHAGDGWMSSTTNEIGYGTSPKELQYFNDVLSLYKKKFNPLKVRLLNRNAIEFRFQSKEVQELFQSVGFSRGKKLSTLKTPDFILNEPKYTSAFLRGLVDTDGHVYWRKSVNKYYLLICWATTAELLASEIYGMLRLLGYNPHITGVQPKSPDGCIRRKMFRINLIRYADVSKYLQEIGFRNETRWLQVYRLSDELRRYGLAINEPARI